MDGRYHRGDETRLVGLQMADHVPLYALERPGLGRLGDELLRVVFAERSDSEIVRLAYCGGGVTFRNGDQSHRGGTATGRGGRALDPLVDGCDPAAKLAHGDSSRKMSAAPFGGAPL
jgi:hypothetical protein